MLRYTHAQIRERKKKGDRDKQSHKDSKRETVRRERWESDEERRM